MEYNSNNTNNKTCGYSNLNIYQTARCGQGVLAPQFASLPFISQFRNPLDYKKDPPVANCCDRYPAAQQTYQNYLVENNLYRSLRQKNYI